MADEIAKITDNPELYGETVSIDKLVKVLKTFSEYYYNTDNPLIPDSIYDILIESLTKRDPDNKFLKEIGARVKDAVKLPYYMPSLDKIKPSSKSLKSNNSLDAWLATYHGEYMISDKLDGISGLFVKKGKSIKMYTRGDGTEGQDITNLIEHIIKIDIKKLPDIAIRGEMIMSRNNFDKVKDRFKNARNAVAGIVNSKKYSSEIATLVDFIGYNVLGIKDNACQQMKLLEEYKFPTVTYKSIKDLNIDYLSKYFIKRRTESDYEIDGIVVSDCSKSYDVTKENPKYAFAFKMMLDDQKAITTVKDVEWNLSKDGYYKPKIVLEPIELVGVTVTYATAFNAKYVNDNKLGPGAIVEIIRSGDVIPYILKVIKPATKAKMPNGEYKWNETGVDIILQDKSNDDIIIKKLAYFFKTLGVKNMGEGIIAKLVNNGYKTIISVLTANKKDLSQIDGLGDKSISKVFDNIVETFNTTDLPTLMAASGLFGRGMGVKRLKLITDKYPNILDIVDLTRDKYLDLIVNIEGFDKITATLFVDNINHFKKFLAALDKISTINIKHLYEKKQNNTPKTGLFIGKKIVLTGFRGQGIEEFIINNGGTTSSSVSKNTDLVIYADGETSSSKYLKAKELGITNIPLSEFKKKYNI